LLLTVNDIMASGDDIPLVSQNDSLKQALLEISSKGLGITGITNEQNTLVGIFSDGDLRRTLNSPIDIQTTSIQSVMTKGGVHINANALAIDALNLMQSKRISALFVVNEENQAVGALNMYMLLKAGVV